MWFLWLGEANLLTTLKLDISKLEKRQDISQCMEAEIQNTYLFELHK